MMRIGSRVLLASSHPHVHLGAACAVCYPTTRKVELQPSQVAHIDDSTVITHSPRVPPTPPPPSPAAVFTSSRSPSSWTMEGMRELGLRKALPLLRNTNVLMDTNEGPQLLDRFLKSANDNAASRLSAEEYARLAEHLTATFTSIPAPRAVGMSSGQAIATSRENRSHMSAKLIPLEHSDDSTGKQQKFFAALRDGVSLVRSQLPQNSKMKPWGPFLCCGTALGIHRDQCFIPHDDDIDLGIAVEDLGSDPAATVMSILNEAAVSGTFVCFDVCGELHRGLELRLLHVASGVRLDVNVYYPPIPVEDDALVLQHASHTFVWCATFYGNSAARKHGMYRYQHAPFYQLLEEVVLQQGPHHDAVSVSIPPVSYLEEYFGADWRTPKKYTYDEGLSGEYKNILPE